MATFVPTSRSPDSQDNALVTLKKMLAARTDRKYGVALSSAVRTATTQTADIDTTGFSSIVFFLVCSSGSGTGGISLAMRQLNEQIPRYHLMGTSTWSITLTNDAGFFVYGLGAGASAQCTLAPFGSFLGGPLPRIIRAEVQHADASNYTYSLSYVLIP